MPEIIVNELSTSIRKQINALKPEITSFAKSFGLMQAKRVDLAPKFMKVYAAISADTTITFVEYVRLFVPNLPTKADGPDGYRNNSTYMACDYLRRLNTQRPRGRANVRDSSTDALARALATILQIVSDVDKVWAAVQTEFKFRERAMTGLRRRVEQTKPLFKMEATKPIKVGTVLHMTPVAQPDEEQPQQVSRRRAA